MIRTLLTTTAIAVLMGSSAFAQATTTPAPATDGQAVEAPAATDGVTGSDLNTGAAQTTDINEPWDMSAGYVAADTDNLGSRLMGQPVYSSTGDDAEEIGTINDLVFSAEGEITAVVIGVGGFLGIGEKSVAVDFGSLEFTLAADNTERWVLPTTADALTNAPDFVWAEDEPVDVNAGGAMAPAPGAAVTPAPAGDAMAPAPGAVVTPAPAGDAMAPAVTTDNTAAAPGGIVPREGYATIERQALTTDNLTGATVIGPNNEDIAEVGDILLDQSGQIEAMLIDFGGFLGIGQKRVAVGLDNIDFASNENGDIVVYTDFTREQLEAAPEYNEETYATDPAMRVNDTAM